MKRVHLVTILIVTLIFAGCTTSEQEQPDINGTQIQVTQDDGLTLDFGSIASTYREGEQIVLELNAKNTGQKPAQNIQTRLFGASFIAGTQPTFPGQTILDGVDRSKNQPGQQTTVTWQIPNPVDLDAGDSDDYTAGVRVLYGYQTTARGTFTLVPQQNFDGNQAPIATRTTAGPLGVDIQVSSPKPIPRTNQETVKEPIAIQIRNNGDGRVADIRGDPLEVQVLNAEFPNTDKATITCPPSVRLYDNTGVIRCTARLPTDVYRQQMTLKLDLGYYYFEEQDTTIRIEGMPGDQSMR